MSYDSIKRSVNKACSVIYKLVELMEEEGYSSREVEAVVLPSLERAIRQIITELGVGVGYIPFRQTALEKLPPLHRLVKKGFDETYE